MTTEEVAIGLVDLCQQGREKEAVERYYHPDIVSVEASGTPGMGPEAKGIDAVKRKHDWWDANFVIHGGNIDGPFVNGEQFATFNTIDCTHTESGQRATMSEIAVYTVKDGKVVREAFFAKPGDGA